jgi:predicted nucleic-acid-binding Zn-ribbon protein
MAAATCIKCGSHHFETNVQEPTGANFKLIFIQCAVCGGVVGVTEYWNVGQRLTDLAKKLGVKLPD